MQDFPNALIAARKARRMTQKQLAEAVNVSRSMVAHWENERANPDVESLRLLTQTLGYNFLEDGGLQAEEPQPQECEALRAHRRQGLLRLALFAGGFMMALLVLALLFPPGAVPPQTSDAMVKTKLRSPYAVDSSLTAAWFQETPGPVANQAYISFRAEQNPVKLTPTENNAGGYTWFYKVILAETNGIDFTPEKFEVYYFSQEDRPEVSGLSGNSMLDGWSPLVIHAYREIEYSGSTPWEPLIGIGILVKGVDAGGNRIEFRYYLKLSNEITV